MLPSQDTYNVVDLLNLGQYGGGQYVEIKDMPSWADRGKTTYQFRYHYERQRALGKQDDEIGRWTALAAGFQHIVWGTSNNGVSAPCNSYADIFIDHGQWAFNGICDWPYGKIFGAGTHRAYPWGGQPRGAGPTEILMFPDKYITDPNCKVNLPELGPQDNFVMTPFRSCTFGTDTWVGGYHERAGLDAIQMVGKAGGDFKKGRIIAGFMGWDFGTGSELGNVYVADTDTAMLVTRGTPVQMRKLSGMGGNLPMVMLLGTVDCLYDFDSMECDDYPAFFMTRAQWGREAGGRIEFDALKIETGVTPESRNPHTGTIIADLKGRNMLIGGIVNFAEASVNVESLIVLDDKHSDGGQQPNLIDINLGRWGLEANFLHEVNGNVYGNPSGFPYDGQNFFYKRFATKRKVEVDREDVAPLAGVVGYKSRLGFQRWNSLNGWSPAFSHSAGTPFFSYADADGSQGGGTTPPPTTCTWVLGTPGAWSACVNNSQTRTTPYVSSVAGCTPTTPKPSPKVETQACVPTGALYTKSPVAITSSTFSEAINPAVAVKKVVITGMKLSAAPNWHAIAVPGTVGTVHLIMAPDGKIYVNNQVATVTGYTGVPVVGTTYPTVTITWSDPITLVRLGTYPSSLNQGTQALRYSATKLEMFAQ
jgi:hypothetical protein